MYKHMDAVADMSRWVRAARQVLWVVAALAIACQAALADPTTLICTNDERPSDLPYKIELDQTHNTVTIDSPAQRFSPSSSAMSPAHSTTYAATFDAQEIKYGDHDWASTIDRLTGIVSSRSEYDGRVVLHSHCQVGKAQF